MPKKATAADAQIVLQLYDFRREPEMRRARAWWGGFWPQSADDIIEVAKNFSVPENAWYRQVIGYWEMAASLVLQGALNENLFLSTNGEMWFILAKVYPFLKEYREKANSPQVFQHCEKLATRTKQGRERLKYMLKQREEWSRLLAAKKG